MRAATNFFTDSVWLAQLLEYPWVIAGTVAAAAVIGIYLHLKYFRSPAFRRAWEADAAARADAVNFSLTGYWKIFGWICF